MVAWTDGPQEEWTKLEQVFEKIWQIPADNYKISVSDLVKLKAQSYQSVYRLCTACGQQAPGGSNKKIGQREVQHQAQRMIENYLRNQAQPQVESCKGEQLLIQTSRTWSEYEFVMKWAQLAFMYVHIHPAMIQEEDEPPSTAVMTVRCFDACIYRNIACNLSTLLLEQVAREREDNHVDRMLMQKLLDMLVQVGLKTPENTLEVYQTAFEVKFLEETAQHYMRCSQQWLQDGIQTYLHKVEQHLLKEEHRATSYLHNSSFKQLTKTVEEELLVKCKDQVLTHEHAGMAALLRTGKTTDLRRMYLLFKRITNGLEKMAEILRLFIQQEGEAINGHFRARDIDDTSYIDGALQLHDKYTSLFCEWLDNDVALVAARRVAFTVFFNEKLPRQGRSLAGTAAVPTIATSTETGEKITTAELLSLYCNYVIRSHRTGDETEQVTMLESIVELAGYIADRDLFFEYYRRHMSRRLLSKSEDTYADQQLVSKLKARFGTAVMKLQGMLQDRAVAADFQDQFRAYCAERQVKCDFTVTVLTMGHWPTFKPLPLILPEEVAINIKLFEEFYDSKTDSRKLKWAHSLGQATLRGCFEKGDKDIVTDSIQGCILLLFNTKEEWEIAEMSRLYGIPEKTIQQEVLPMLVGKYKILKKRSPNTLQQQQQQQQCSPTSIEDVHLVSPTSAATPQSTASPSPTTPSPISAQHITTSPLPTPVMNKLGGRKLDVHDILYVNTQFVDRCGKITIPALKAKIKDEIDKEVEASINEDRRLKMEACIVRIMKASKQLRHVELKTKCIDQLKHQFVPDPRAIKRRIDDLISRGYMKRADEDNNTFEYIA